MPEIFISDLGRASPSSAETEDPDNEDDETYPVDEEEIDEEHGELLMRVDVLTSKVNCINLEYGIFITNNHKNPNAPTRFRDFLGGIPRLISVSASGWGLFPCPENGAAIWVVHEESTSA